MAQFFTSLFEITAYTENQQKTNEALASISKELQFLRQSQTELRKGQEEYINKIDGLNQQVEILKEGLQVELFESLQNLHERLTNKHWASYEEKQDAKRYYDRIHNLGKDGWSQTYYDEIMKLPNSREELYAKQ